MSATDRLRHLLRQPDFLIMPCAFDALSARLIEEAGFALTFMSGFAVAAARFGLPDTGLVSYGEVVETARNITDAVTLPVIGDGDTGYGNPMSVKRTVAGFAKAGLAAVMIEDQLSPKRCGHTEGKSVVGRAEAQTRLRAAIDARNDGADILILARTDARATLGIDEAVTRARLFREMGADITFLEAPRSLEEMRRYCGEVEGPKMANMLEGGMTPVLAPQQLAEMGYKIAAYPLTLLSGAVAAMRDNLAALRDGRTPAQLTDWPDLRRLAGFEDYDRHADRYRTSCG